MTLDRTPMHDPLEARPAPKRRLALPHVSPWVVGVIGTMLGTVMALAILSHAGWNATVFLTFGEESSETRQYAEERLDEIVLRQSQGHDGKYFFIQANDPWLLNPAENVGLIPLAHYRAQRMLFPVLAGGGGVLGPQSIVWSMLGLNLAALGLGSWAVARLAVEMGGHPLWGLSFVLNPGMVFEMKIGGAGILAAALAFWGVLLMLRGTTGWAVVCITCAALTREPMLIVAVGTAFWLATQRLWRPAMATIAAPFLAVASWALYVRVRLPVEVGERELAGIGAPFVGLGRAASTWLGSSVNLAAGLLVLAALVVYVWALARRPHLVGWAFIGFVPLAVILSGEVWQYHYDISRAVAPALTALVLLLFAGRGAHRATATDPSSPLGAGLPSG